MGDPFERSGGSELAECDLENLSREELMELTHNLRKRIAELEAVVRSIESLTSDTSVSEINLSELNKRFTSIIPRAAAGEEFLITYSNGPVLAVLTKYLAEVHGALDSITQSQLRNDATRQMARVTDGEGLRIRIRGSKDSDAVLLPPPENLKARLTPARRRKIAEALGLEPLSKQSKY